MEGKRLRRWKRIAAHLGVTQSTAIRWSKLDGFPLIKLENGGSVYADSKQLDAWLTRRGSGGDASSRPAGTPSLRLPLALRRSKLMAVLALLVAIAGGIWLISSSGLRQHGFKSSGDLALDARYRQARSAWASRTNQGVTASVLQFEAIVAQNPSFVAGLTGLADAHILSCEFGNADRAEAFRDAGNAVAAALSIDPKDADANRIKGFLTYWQTRDIAKADPYFDKAIAAGNADYLVFLWYGNALIDAGRVDEGKAKLDHAILLSPESPAVATDHALALWQWGDSQGALAELAAVQARNPMNPEPYSYAAMLRLAQGNVPEYLSMSEHWARLAGDQRQIDRVAGELRAFQTGGRDATLRLIAATSPYRNNPYWHGGNLPAAIAASLLGDGPLLAGILQRKSAVYDVSKEDWRPLRFPLEPFVRWKADPVIAPLILRQFRIAAMPDFAERRAGS